MNDTINFDAPSVDTPTISSSAMLVELSISQWAGRKTDKRVTKKVKDDEGAIENSGSFSKNLLPDEPIFDRVGSLMGAMRTEHYHSTMPWANQGPRLLTTPIFFDYNKTLTALKQEQEEDALPHFFAEYDRMVARAPHKLAGLFDIYDYPDLDTLKQKFSVALNYYPVPTAGDFRVDVGNEAMEVLRSSYASYYDTQLKGAYKDVWRRTHDALANMSKRLEGKEKQRFHDTLVTNVTDMVELLDKFNITDDADMRKAKRRLEQALRGITPDGLREDSALRLETKAKVDEVLKEFSW